VEIPIYADEFAFLVPRGNAGMMNGVLFTFNGHGRLNPALAELLHESA